MRFSLIIFIPFLISLGQLFAQNNSAKPSTKEPHILFTAHPEQEWGFDSYHYKNTGEYYEKIKIGKNSQYLTPYKSIGKGKTDKVFAELENFNELDISRLEFLVNDSNIRIPFFKENDTLLSIVLPSSEIDYFVRARYKGSIIGQLNVDVFSPIKEKITIVSLVKTKTDLTYLTEFLNENYKQANISFKVQNSLEFKDSLYNDKFLFDNPSSLNDRYTEQMRELRDLFFDRNPSASKESYYIFLVAGFVDENIKGYMPRSKSMAFIKAGNEPDMFHAIARELGHGIGILNHFWLEAKTEKGETLNLMDENGGSELLHFQWLQLRHSSNSFSFYDGDEDVRTNNGMIAYYFWSENKNGYIDLNGEHPLVHIQRPYKKNYLSYHLNINDELFKIIYQNGSFVLCTWHVIVFSSLLLIYLTVRLILFIRARRSGHKQRYVKKKMLHWTLLGSLILSGFVTFKLIDWQLTKYEVKSGLIEAFHKKNERYTINNILFNTNLRHKESKTPRSEILIKRGDNWYMKRRRKVLYFNVYKNSKNEFVNCRYVRDSDSLVLSKLKYKKLSSSHYIVMNYYNSKDSLESQKAYNHLGIEISNKLKLEDAAKRILVFVNGYRPTSVGHSFEENFKDIQNNGLEFQNSSNLIYSFDRFDYWRPWQEMDKRFKKRLNPSEVFYADGHFSVATSNYESLLNFTKISAMYPERCKNRKKHICYKTKKTSTGLFGSNEINTYDLLPRSPNSKGFNERYRKGRIAAKNLLQMFNEIPNKSSNDTLYLVVHSMGYAYSLGMIKELRGKINFGGFYIIAPENASIGKVKRSEWQEVWQYGSKWNEKEKDPPCLQDGVAPQICAKGLNESDRVYIPEKLYYRKGFYDSHFIGYYTWIFDIKKGRRGYISQR